MRGSLFWGPYNRDPTIWGTILGSPLFGNSHIYSTGQSVGEQAPMFPDPGRLLLLLGGI